MNTPKGLLNDAKPVQNRNLDWALVITHGKLPYDAQKSLSLPLLYLPLK